jgi:hypothetical protein
MAIPSTKIELGFDLTETGAGPFLTLDNPVSGQLDNSDWVLGGTLFYDVTDAVRSVAITRGKNRDTDTFDPGFANVVFNNNDRTFDPTYEDSPYFGQIIPKRQIRISSNDRFSFVGVVDDWNLSYESLNNATTAAAATDAFTYFNTQTLTGGTQTVQTSGERINAILSDPSVNWPEGSRTVDTGAQTLGADVIEPGTNALQYLQLVEQSEPGSFFIGKDGSVVFQDRTVAATSDGVVLADDGTGIKWANAEVVYGSEQLYNEIEINTVITGGTAVAIDADSQTEYGIQNLTRTGLLMSTDTAAQELADYYASKYSQPEYRFDSVTLVLNELTTDEANEILDLEIGNVVKVKFTPSGIPPAIERYAQVIGIDQSIEPNRHQVDLKFATLDFTLLVLDDAQFGKLDAGNALAF